MVGGESVEKVMQTKSGVVYDIARSPFEFERHGMLYKFSSVSHRDKFIANVMIKEDWLNDSLSRRFKMNVDVRLLADLQLYRQIESRGYYVKHIESGREYRDSWKLELAGLQVKWSDLEKPSSVTTEMLIG